MNARLQIAAKKLRKVSTRTKSKKLELGALCLMDSVNGDAHDNIEDRLLLDQLIQKSRGKEIKTLLWEAKEILY